MISISFLAKRTLNLVIKSINLRLCLLNKKEKFFLKSRSDVNHYTMFIEGV